MSTVAKEKGRHWRDSNDYRADYFRNYPGILGKVFICSQCTKPLWDRHNVEVDHITAPSKFAKKKVDRRGVVHNTSLVSELLNHTFNLASICPDCNKRKSNKHGIVTVKGYIAKGVEVSLYSVQNAALIGLWGGKKVTSIASQTLLPKSIRPRKRKGPVRKPKIQNSPLSSIFAGLLYIILTVLWYGVRSAIKLGRGVRKLFKSFFGSKLPFYVKLLVPAFIIGILFYLWKTI